MPFFFFFRFVHTFNTKLTGGFHKDSYKKAETLEMFSQASRLFSRH
jgi:hypothetical protein